MRVKVTYVLLLATLVFSVMACKETETKQNSIRPVRTAKPIVSKKSNSNITLPASINELRETKLSFRVGGPLLQLNDIKGTYVNKGDIIAQIDPRDFKLAVEATKTQYEQAKAEYERYKNLRETKTVAKNVFDKIEMGYKLSKTNYEKAKNALADIDIRAPFSGYINNVFVNNYEMVQPGQPILSLIDVSQYEVNAWLPINDAANVNKNSIFRCKISLKGKNFYLKGKLKEIGTKTSFTKQTLPITVIVSAPDSIQLRPGMTTFLEIAEQTKNTNTAFTIPTSAIFTKNNKPYVWILNNESSTVSAHVITTRNFTEANSIEVFGITGNEDIVTAGVHYLFEGQKVKKMEQFSKSNIGNKL